MTDLLRVIDDPFMDGCAAITLKTCAIVGGKLVVMATCATHDEIDMYIDEMILELLAARQKAHVKLMELNKHR